MILNVVIFIMNGTECDVKNYVDRGKCHPLRPKVEVDNSLQDLHIVLLFIENSLFLCS